MKEVITKLTIIVIRVGLGLLLIVAGIGKMPSGYPQIVDQANVVGNFFKCMIDTGLYWKWIGACQIISGLLLVSQRFSSLGAIFAMPIFVNVLMITISFYPNFGATLYLNIFCFSLCLFLLAFDYKNWKWLLIKSK